MYLIYTYIYIYTVYIYIYIYIYTSGSQTGGRGPLGGHKMALGGPQREYDFLFFFYLYASQDFPIWTMMYLKKIEIFKT